MHIEGTGRFVYYAQWPVAVFLPVFFFLGRGNLGAGVGWLGFFGLVYGLIVIALLLVPPALTLFDREVRRERATRLSYDIASAVLWLGFLLGALTVPDAGDSGPLDTVLMAWWGITAQTSAALFAISAALIGLAYLAQLVLAVRGIARGRAAVAKG
ncbi:class I SAM-dependent methyltransferase [Microbacterium sp. HJ5]